MDTTKLPASPFVGIDAKTMRVPRKSSSFSGGRFRILGNSEEGECYHIMSRTVGGEFLLDDDIEREAFRKLMWKMADFLGIRVLTYAVMRNHFHVLIEVPHRETWLQRFDGPQGEEALLKHLGSFYGKGFIAMLREELGSLRSSGNEFRYNERLQHLKRRFCDLSIFVKELKERYTRWFNKRHARKGTMWMDRFKSVLVQNGPALRTMAAYIDLNPVRAGLVEDPKDYAWSGYGEAMSGSRRAQRGLCKAMDCGIESWDKTLPRDEVSAREKYRVWLYADGKERVNRAGKVTKKGFDRETSESVVRDEKGKLSADELIQTRVRHFSEGLVLGSRAWVEEVFRTHRENFGPKRKTGARKLTSSASDLYAMRQLE